MRSYFDQFEFNYGRVNEYVFCATVDDNTVTSIHRVLECAPVYIKCPKRYGLCDTTTCKRRTVYVKRDVKGD